MKRIIYFLTAIMILGSSCQDEADTIVPADNGENDNTLIINTCDEKAILTEVVITKASDEYWLKDVRLNGDCLAIDIAYGGGCGNSEADLFGIYRHVGSQTPQVDLIFMFEDNDLCEALIQKTFQYDLTPLRSEFMNVIELYFPGWDEIIVYEY
jgi:hypothetical protein